MSGYALDARPDHQTRLIEALLVKMRGSRHFFKWNKSSSGELFAAVPGLIILLTPTAVLGDSKLMIRLLGASKHSEIPLGSEEDRELRGMILETDPQVMDGDEWICSQAEAIISA